jgi:hypothetical protein
VVTGLDRGRGGRLGLDRPLKHGSFGTSAIRNPGAIKEIFEFKTLDSDSDSETEVFYLPVSTVRRQPGRPITERTEAEKVRRMGTVRRIQKRRSVCCAIGHSERTCKGS